VPVVFTAGLTLGWLSIVVAPYLAAVYFGSLVVYALFSLTFAARASAKHGWRLFPVMPLVFLTYHLGYGIGFARGLWDFFVLCRSPRADMTILSRPTAVPSVNPNHNRAA
jgi:hypothetical protein